MSRHDYQAPLIVPIPVISISSGASFLVPLLIGFPAAVLLSLLVLLAVTTADFSGGATVPEPTLGPCEPFCPPRTTAPAPSIEGESR